MAANPSLGAAPETRPNNSTQAAIFAHRRIPPNESPVDSAGLCLERAAAALELLAAQHTEIAPALDLAKLEVLDAVELLASTAKPGASPACGQSLQAEQEEMPGVLCHAVGELHSLLLAAHDVLNSTLDGRSLDRANWLIGIALERSRKLFSFTFGPEPEAPEPGGVDHAQG